METDDGREFVSKLLTDLLSNNKLEFFLEILPREMFLPKDLIEVLKSF